MRNLKLRALTSTDIPLTLKWNNQEEIKDLYAGHPFPVNLEMEVEWYDKITKSNIPTTVFGIELISNNKLIGISILKNINLIHRNAEIAIYIGDSDNKGKGFGTEAVVATLDFGFRKIGLHRVYLYVQNKNKNAVNLYTKLGFKYEGTLRKASFLNGEFIDNQVMSLLIDEFLDNDI